MKIKKYIANSFKEGKLKIIEELGDDAIILSNRNIKKPDGSELIEIVAAIDNQSFPGNSNIQKKKGESTDKQIENKDENEKVDSKVYDEFEKIRIMLHNLSEDINIRNNSNFNQTFSKLLDILIEAGLSEKLAKNILVKIKEENDTIDLNSAFSKVKNLIRQSIIIDDEIEGTEESQNIVLFGPSGSGKTITIAKLAVIMKLVNNANPKIITTDTYKVNSLEQMETYASLANISFKAAYSESELSEILKKEYESDLRFIDTPGVSYKNEEEFQNVLNFIKASNPDKKYLVISGNSNRQTLKEMIQEYKDIEPYSVIITKTDECATIGGIYETIRENKLGISYFTTGQNIPNDIEMADKDSLTDMILPNVELKRLS